MDSKNEIASKELQIRISRYFDQLSKKFNFRIEMTGMVYLSGKYGTFTEYSRIEILSKNDSLLQVFSHVPTYDFYDDLKDVRSFETGYRINNQVIDGYMGTLVVGDFNLDSLTDFAVSANVPETSGKPSYTFYFQKSNGSFENNKYFTNHVYYIPEKLDYAKRKFSTHGYTGCCMHTFRYYEIDSAGRFRMTYEIEKDARDE